MPTHLVNLDALIKREDFETEESAPQNNQDAQLRLDDLEPSRLWFNLLRKPDFQRETSNWGPQTIVDLVKSVLDGDVVPAIIIWWSPLSGKVFVIDGAHRVSALIAWVNDDYGDGDISRQLFGTSISPAQQRLATETRVLVNDEIGEYKQLKKYASDPAGASLQTRQRASSLIKNIATQRIIGDAEKAETSFFRINGSPVVIDPTELSVISARRKPNTIATRALMQAGLGHKYWSRFTQSKCIEIENLAKEVYGLLFNPILDAPTIKTTDVPIAGQAYSGDSFKMILDLVNVVNDITPSMWTHHDELPKRTRQDVTEQLDDDGDGSATIQCLEKLRSAAWLVSGEQAKSLGLHPLVYFYGSNGLFQSAALAAAMKFLTKLKNEDRLFEFTKYRKDFEDFLVRHGHFLQQVVGRKGSRMRPLESIITMWSIVLEGVKNGLNDDQLVQQLLANPKLFVLKAIPADIDSNYKPRLSKEAKNTAFIRDAINTTVRCSVCGARLHAKSMSVDHDKRIEDGGSHNPENLKNAHFYCNTGYKEKLHAKQKTSTANTIAVSDS